MKKGMVTLWVMSLFSSRQMNQELVRVRANTRKIQVLHNMAGKNEREVKE